MNPNNAELERASNSSAESLSPPFRSVHVSFTAGSSDSLNSDTQAGSDGSKWLQGGGKVALALRRDCPILSPTAGAAFAKQRS